jgi:hypothetical protein
MIKAWSKVEGGRLAGHLDRECATFAQDKPFVTCGLSG